MIRSLRSLGKTILLTTHYLDEAEQLADRVAVLREGRIIREGTPAELTGGHDETEIRYRRDGEEVVDAHDASRRRSCTSSRRRRLPRAASSKASTVRRPTLEDVYLLLDRGRGRVRLFWHQLRGEQLVFWRSREAAVFVFLFPLLLFALLTARLQRRDLRQARRRGRCSPGCSATALRTPRSPAWR